MTTHDDAPHRVSLVIPVYKGEKTLPVLVSEVARLTKSTSTPGGNVFVVSEVLLVHDCGPDQSDLTIQSLASQYPFVQPVWLTRNSGQHPATMAGMASATGAWVATLDEDGQQNPEEIGVMLDFALAKGLQVVYARPLNPPPHGWLRNGLSAFAKAISTRLLGNRSIGSFNSFRLIEGEIARTLAAYCGNGVYLDVGLNWIAGRVGHCPVNLRHELDRPSGYSYVRLLGHFWHLVITSGTRPLRLITMLGIFSVFLACVLAVYAVYARFYGANVQGWASLLTVVSFFSGCILTALGVIAEYLAVTMGIVMGRPLYVVSTKAPRRPSPK